MDLDFLGFPIRVFCIFVWLGFFSYSILSVYMLRSGVYKKFTANQVFAEVFLNIITFACLAISTCISLIYAAIYAVLDYYYGATKYCEYGGIYPNCDKIFDTGQPYKLAVIADYMEEYILGYALICILAGGAVYILLALHRLWAGVLNKVTIKQTCVLAVLNAAVLFCFIVDIWIIVSGWRMLTY